MILTRVGKFAITFCALVICLCAVTDFIIIPALDKPSKPKPMKQEVKKPDPAHEWFVIYGTVKGIHSVTVRDIGSGEPNWYVVMETDDGKNVTIPFTLTSPPPVWVGEHIKLEFGGRPWPTAGFTVYKGWKQ